MRSLFVLVGTGAAIRGPYVVLHTLGDKMRIQFKELLVKNPKLEQTKNAIKLRMVPLEQENGRVL